MSNISETIIKLIDSGRPVLDIAKLFGGLDKLSPNLPKTKAPNGLTINPAANVASVESKAAVGSALGKNCMAMMGARLPNK